LNYLSAPEIDKPRRVKGFGKTVVWPGELNGAKIDWVSDKNA
jgi:hypothetical protein